MVALVACQILWDARAGLHHGRGAHPVSGATVRYGSRRQACLLSIQQRGNRRGGHRRIQPTL